MWTDEQDIKLQFAVHKYGVKKWKVIAREVGKTKRSCVSRWNVKLKSVWTAEKMFELLRLRESEGLSWAAISEKIGISVSMVRLKFKKLKSESNINNML
jgi:hypothetical protein